MQTMREVNLSGIDLNLLPPLEALLRRRNVTHAAAEAGMSQPAMSRALARLRNLLGDPLLVRARGGLALTPRGEQLARQLAPTLDSVKLLFDDPAFDPALARRTVRIAAVDTQTILYAPRLMSRLAREAPDVKIVFEPLGRDVEARMEQGALDLAFAIASTPLPAGAMSEPIADDPLALVMRAGHPRASQCWRIEDYGDVDHAVITIFGDDRSDLDAILAQHGVTRRITLATPHFTAALAAVAATDMVTTISRRFAERFADAFNLVLRDPPFHQVEMRELLVWNHVRANDPLLAWLRNVIRSVASEVAAETAVS